MGSALRSPVTDLPEPDAAARAHSERVDGAHSCRDRIVAGGASRSRATWSSRSTRPVSATTPPERTKLGAAGDFVTAPEMTPLFATALATQVAAILDATERRDIVELGGRQRPARRRSSAGARGARRVAVALCDSRGQPGSGARASARRSPRRARALRERVTWIDALPEAIDGA